MKTVKVSDLSGPALDWAVAKCEYRYTSFDWLQAGRRQRYSREWANAGPIIERERIDVCHVVSEDGWQAITADSHFVFRARTPLLAAMRCYVASRLGDTVEIPEELV